MKALTPSEYQELRSLYESIYLPKIETVLDEFTDEELDELTDEYIKEEVESFFLECLDEGLDITVLEEVICESIDASLEILSEATVTTGQGSRMAARARLDRMRSAKRGEALKRVKSAVKSVAKGTIGLAARAAGTAVRAGSAAATSARKGYERGRYGSGGSSSSSSDDSSSDSQSSTSSSSSSRRSSTTPARRKDGLLKRGLKKIVRGVGKTVSTGLGAAKAASDYVVNRAAKQ
jgi:hypothetical protein